MFTGLVETKGQIDSFEKNEDGMILRIPVSYTHLRAHET